MTTTEPPAGGSTSDPRVPPVTEAIREQARRAPNSWIYSVDGAYDPQGAVPPYAIVGAWPVDERGRLGSFVSNTDYRPSPAALRLDAPTDSVDAALQLAATGHRPDSDVAAALAQAPVYLPADAAGEPIAYRSDDGTEFVAVFTDPSKAPATAAQLLSVDIRTVVGVLPDDTTVTLNPGSQVAASLTSAELRNALEAATAAEARSTAD